MGLVGGQRINSLFFLVHERDMTLLQPARKQMGEKSFTIAAVALLLEKPTSLDDDCRGLICWAEPYRKNPF